MCEVRIAVLGGARQRDPQLQPVDVLVRCVGGDPLGVHDAASGAHPVDRTGPDRLERAEAVAMHDLTVQQIRDGREVQVRMRPHRELR